MSVDASDRYRVNLISMAPSEFIGSDGVLGQHAKFGVRNLSGDYEAIIDGVIVGEGLLERCKNLARLKSIVVQIEGRLDSSPEVWNSKVIAAALNGAVDS